MILCRAVKINIFKYFRFLRNKICTRYTLSLSIWIWLRLCIVISLLSICVRWWRPLTLMSRYRGRWLEVTVEGVRVAGGCLLVEVSSIKHRVIISCTRIAHLWSLYIVNFHLMTGLIIKITRTKWSRSRSSHCCDSIFLLRTWTLQVVQKVYIHSRSVNTAWWIRSNLSLDNFAFILHFLGVK